MATITARDIADALEDAGYAYEQCTSSVVGSYFRVYRDDDILDEKYFVVSLTPRVILIADDILADRTYGRNALGLRRAIEYMGHDARIARTWP